MVAISDRVIFYIPGFDCVDRLPLLSALAGIMLALFKKSTPPKYGKLIFILQSVVR